MSAEEIPDSCEVCQGMYYERFEASWQGSPNGPRDLIITFPTLLNSAAAGCKYCGVVMNAARWAWGEHPEIVEEELFEGPVVFNRHNAVNWLRIQINPIGRLTAQREIRNRDVPHSEYIWEGMEAIELFTPHGRQRNHD